MKQELLEKEFEELKQKRKKAKQEGNKEEEKILIEQMLQINPNYVKAMSSRIRIAREEGDKETEKKFLERILEINPNDILAISSLIRVTREYGEFETEKKLLNRRLELEPDDIRTLSSLIVIARKNNDLAEEKRLEERILEIEPENLIAMSGLIRIAKKEGNIEEQKKWIIRQLEIKPDDLIMKNALAKVMKKKSTTLNIQTAQPQEKKEIFKLVLQNSEELAPAEQARKLIYTSEKITEDLETIVMILQEEKDEFVKALVQAEAALKAGINDRVGNILKRYKKKSQAKGDSIELKIIDKAIALYKGARICDPIKWEELYKEYAYMRKKQKSSEDDLERR